MEHSEVVWAGTSGVTGFIDSFRDGFCHEKEEVIV